MEAFKIALMDGGLIEKDKKAAVLGIVLGGVAVAAGLEAFKFAFRLF